ncbi:hypothetical protein BGZ88_011057 [Linnemannia elongata]|nr:hypothetical protein BGZ88_011057 [Linnemannia elongata]
MEEFVDDHVNHDAARCNIPVAPFFSPKSKPSEPALMFFNRIDGTRDATRSIVLLGATDWWEQVQDVLETLLWWVGMMSQNIPYAPKEETAMTKRLKKEDKVKDAEQRREE